MAKKIFEQIPVFSSFENLILKRNLTLNSFYQNDKNGLWFRQFYSRIISFYGDKFWENDNLLDFQNQIAFSDYLAQIIPAFWENIQKAKPENKSVNPISYSSNQPTSKSLLDEDPNNFTSSIKTRPNSHEELKNFGLRRDFLADILNLIDNWFSNYSSNAEPSVINISIPSDLVSDNSIFQQTNLTETLNFISSKLDLFETNFLTIEEDFSDFNNSLTSLNGLISSNTSAISGIQGNITTINQQIVNLNGSIDNIILTKADQTYVVAQDTILQNNIDLNSAEIDQIQQLIEAQIIKSNRLTPGPNRDLIQNVEQFLNNFDNFTSSLFSQSNDGTKDVITQNAGVVFKANKDLKVSFNFIIGLISNQNQTREIEFRMYVEINEEAPLIYVNTQTITGTAATKNFINTWTYTPSVDITSMKIYFSITRKTNNPGNMVATVLAQSNFVILQENTEGSIDLADYISQNEFNTYKANQEIVNNSKANSSDVYLKSETYTQLEINNELDLKANQTDLDSLEGRVEVLENSGGGGGGVVETPIFEYEYVFPEGSQINFVIPLPPETKKIYLYDGLVFKRHDYYFKEFPNFVEYGEVVPFGFDLRELIRLNVFSIVVGEISFNFEYFRNELDEDGNTLTFEAPRDVSFKIEVYI